MTYNQIKNIIVPPAKRTAQTVHKWVQKLPNLALAGAILQIGWAILTYDLTRILVLGMFCPIGVLVSYGILLAALLVLLAAYNIYANREALAKAMVVLLAEL